MMEFHGERGSAWQEQSFSGLLPDEQQEIGVDEMEKIGITVVFVL